MRMSGIAVGLALAVGAAGCNQKRASAAPMPAHYMIGADELSHATEISLYDAIRRLRPNFLTARGHPAYGAPETTELSLYVNGVRMDSIEDLRRISCAEVAMVRFYEPQYANTRFPGHNNAGGAIDVTLKSTEDSTTTAGSPRQPPPDSTTRPSTPPAR
jgi:hypothetical protein